MAVVQNGDIATLIRKVNRMREEVVKSQSSNHNSLKNADKTRIVAYHADLKRYIEFTNELPEMDMPESHPTDITVPDTAVLPVPENEALAHLDQIYSALYQEVIYSQSARDSAGLVTHDAVRFNSLIDKAQTFLDGYIAEMLPTDYPESSPQRELTGQGRRTIGSK